MSNLFLTKAMTNTQTGRMQNQEDWKRTQVRMPQEQYFAIASFAKQNNISLNSAMILLMDKGLLLETPHTSIKSISTEDLMSELSKRFEGHSIALVNNQNIQKTDQEK